MRFVLWLEQRRMQLQSERRPLEEEQAESMRTTGHKAQAKIALNSGPSDDSVSLGDHARAIGTSHGYGIEFYAARQPSPPIANPYGPHRTGAHNQDDIPPIDRPRHEETLQDPHSGSDDESGHRVRR